MQKNSKASYIHIAVIVIFMFGFGFIPPVAPITTTGMRVIGVFIGTIYGWIAYDMVWTSIMAMFAVVANGICPIGDWLSMSFANETVVFIFLTFIFTGAILDTGITEHLARKLLSIKAINGRPWVFTVLIFIIATAGGLVNSYAICIFLFVVMNSIYKAYGFKKGDVYPRLMTLAIVICAQTIFLSIFPYDINAQVTIGAYAGATGEKINSLQWFAFSIPLTILLLAVLFLLYKFVFRIDLSGMNNLSVEKVFQGEEKPMNKEQKAALFYIILFTIVMTVQGLLPSLAPDWIVSQFLDQLGLQGVMLILIALLMMTKVEGKKIANMKTATQFVDWRILSMLAFAFPFATLISSEGTGIVPFIAQILTPLFAGKSLILFYFVASLLALVLTNFLNNSMLIVTFLSVGCPLLVQMGANPMPFALIVARCCTYAYLTPSASGAAAFYFGQDEWVDRSGLSLLQTGITMLAFYVITFIFGYPYLMAIL